MGGGVGVGGVGLVLESDAERLSFDLNLGRHGEAARSSSGPPPASLAGRQAGRQGRQAGSQRGSSEAARAEWPGMA